MEKRLVYVFVVMVMFVIHHSETIPETKPNIYSPPHLQYEKYELIISTTSIDRESKFWGTVHITVRCLTDTDRIILHQKDLQISQDHVLVQSVGKPAHSFMVINSLEKSVNNDDFLIILKENLEAEKKYKIEIKFRKIKFSHDSGYISKSLMREILDNGNNTKYRFRQETYTKIGPFEARRVFPCFDQMDMKATFKIWLAHSNLVQGFSNGKLIVSKPMPNKPDWVLDEFEETVPIAPFSVAFALLDVDSKMFVEPISMFEIRFLTDKTITDKMDYALMTTSRIFQFFSEYFDISVELKKLDIMTVRNFEPTIQANFGFITIREQSALEYFQESSDTSVKFSVILEMCDAISQQWIRNLVTMSRRNEDWLHLGLNMFLQTICINKTFSEWEFTFTETNTVEKFEYRLTTDALCTFRLLFMQDLIPIFSPNIENERDIVEKGYQLFRMMNLFLGPDIFQKAISNYLKRFKSANSNINEVWSEFSEVAKEAKILPEPLKVETIMESWVSQKGYPLITVVRNNESKIVSVTQKPFVILTELNNYEIYDGCWIVPLTYTTKRKLDSKDVTLEWITCNGPLELSYTDLNHDNWIIFNMGINVLARVNYDAENWLLIQKSLLDDSEYLDFDHLTRVHLISDMFALAEAGKLSYGFLFDTMKYLSREQSYEPLKIALKEFDKIRSRLLGTNFFKSYQKYVREILNGIFENEKYKSMQQLTNADQFNVRLNLLIIESSCIFGVDGCEKQSIELTRKWKSKSFSERSDVFSPQIRRTVLCSGIKHGDTNDWVYIWNQYSNKRVSHENEDILSALGCSISTKNLNKYLKMSLDKEKIGLYTSTSLKVFQSLSSNEKGYKQMKKFFEKYYDEIFAFHLMDKTAVFSYVKILLNATTIRKDLRSLVEFASSKKLNLSDRDAEESIKNAFKNVVWLEKHKESLKSYFDAGILGRFRKMKNSSSTIVPV